MGIKPLLTVPESSTSTGAISLPRVKGHLPYRKFAEDVTHRDPERLQHFGTIANPRIGQPWQPEMTGCSFSGAKLSISTNRKGKAR